MSSLAARYALKKLKEKGALMVCHACILADSGMAVHCGECGCCNLEPMQINWYFVGAALFCALIWVSAYLIFGGK